MYFNSWNELEAYIESLGLFRMRPGLERIAKVLTNLGLQRPPFTVIQVVGTNGKGSTASFLASLACAHGLRCGLHTSPHFLSCRERLRILEPQGSTASEAHTLNTETQGLYNILPEELWLQAAEQVMAGGGASLSYFELLTALAVTAFTLAKADIAVMETGLGGTFDATTALAADCVVFTPIDLDHCNILGDTLAAIARDKAGAIRPGQPVFSSPQPPAALKELQEEAAQQAAPIHLIKENAWRGLPPDILSSAAPLKLAGEHQWQNAALALAAWRYLQSLQKLGKPQDRADIAAMEQKGLCEAWLPGRLQYIPARTKADCPHPALLLDGAHNAHGMAALGLELGKKGLAPSAVIFACLEDKNPQSLAAHLRALATGPVFVPFIHDNPRALPPEELAALIGLNATPVPDIGTALDMAASHCRERYGNLTDCPPVLICGSLYLLGEFFAAFPEYLNPEYL